MGSMIDQWKTFADESREIYECPGQYLLDSPRKTGGFDVREVNTKPIIETNIKSFIMLYHSSLIAILKRPCRQWTSTYKGSAQVN